MLFFKTKKPDISETTNKSQDNIDLQIINKMNQEFALSLDFDETLNTALQVIIARLNAEAANIFLINNKTKKFECILSLQQEHLDQYQLDLTDGVMGRAVKQRKCIRVGNVRLLGMIKCFKSIKKIIRKANDKVINSIVVNVIP